MVSLKGVQKKLMQSKYEMFEQMARKLNFLKIKMTMKNAE